MSVMMHTELAGLTSSQFETLFAPLFGQIKTFPGFIANASGPTSDGYQVTEVWESQEAHERWVREVIAPAVQRAGIGQVPPVQYESLDRFFTR